MRDISVFLAMTSSLALPMSLPPELEDHIRLLSTHPWFNDLVPRRAGCTTNAFFQPNARTHRVPSVEVRVVSVPVPEELRVVYARYPSDTEFTADDWVFLSEDEIARRRLAMVAEGQLHLVDLAIAYAGMGHVTVLSYDPESRCVLTSMDGGANMWDRERNHRDRVHMTVELIPKVSFATWWSHRNL